MVRWKRLRAGRKFGSGRYCFMFRPPGLCAPRLSVPLRKRPQGRRGFYVRAEPASPLPQAPDMPTVRIQAIDSTGTFTLSDPQPGRLLISIPPVSTDSGRCGIPGENSSGTSMAHKELTMWISSDSLVIPRDQNSPQAPAYQRIRNGAFAGGRPARSPLGLRLPYPITPQWRPLNREPGASPGAGSVHTSVMPQMPQRVQQPEQHFQQLPDAQHPAPENEASPGAASTRSSVSSPGS